MDAKSETNMAEEQPYQLPLPYTEGVTHYMPVCEKPTYFSTWTALKCHSIIDDVNEFVKMVEE